MSLKLEAPSLPHVQSHDLQRVPYKLDSFTYHTTLKPIKVIGKMHAGSNENPVGKTF